MPSSGGCLAFRFSFSGAGRKGSNLEHLVGLRGNMNAALAYVGSAGALVSTCP